MQKKKDADKKIEKSSCCPAVGEVLQHGFFKAFGDPTRISLLVNLLQKEEAIPVGEVAECCPVDQSVVSRHLAILRDAGIIEAKKKGREVFYSVRFSELVGNLRGMADAIEQCCLNQKDTSQEESS